MSGIETGFLVFKPVGLSRYFENANVTLDMSRRYCLHCELQICNSFLVQTADLPTHSVAVYVRGVVAFATHMQEGSQRRHIHGGARRVTTSIITSASWSLFRNPYVIIMIVGRNKWYLK